MKPGKVTFVDIVVDMEPVQEQAGRLEEVFADLREQIKKTAQQLTATFAGTDVTKTVNMSKYIEKFSDQLLYLRLNLGRLKAAITDAAAPIGAVLLPAVNRTVNGLIRLTNAIGLVLGALVDGVTGTDAAADSAQNAAQAEQNLASAVKAARRSLAGFDEIERLDAPAGSTSGTSQVLPEVEEDTLSPRLQAIVDRVLKLIEPLQAIDFTPLRTALEQLGEVFGTVWEQIGGVLEWVWFEILAPLVTWILEELAPVIAETLTAALETFSAVLVPVFTGLQLLWQALEPIVTFIGEAVITVLQSWQQVFEDLTEVFTQKGPQIAGIFQNVAEVVTAVWAVVEPILQQLLEQWTITFGSISQLVSQVVGFIIDALFSVTEFLTGVFTGDWERAWEGLSWLLKGIINGIIGMLNAMLAGITGALNGVIRVANTLSFKAPDWVPGLGGEVFGLNLKTVKTPQIPYLAKGAVLPANRPFLAMVGDQRHGTNVEAPLATIQEAVTAVTAQQTGALLAAMEASIGVQQEILSAVLGIQIGDSVIAQAVDRYRSKMAVVHGTRY